MVHPSKTFNDTISLPFKAKLSKIRTLLSVVLVVIALAQLTLVKAIGIDDYRFYFAVGIATAIALAANVFAIHWSLRMYGIRCKRVDSFLGYTIVVVSYLPFL